MTVTSCDYLDVPPSDVDSISMKQEASSSKRVNVRRAEIMEKVELEITHHYQSELISTIRNQGNSLILAHTEFKLAQEFGFCNGVRRAIDIAYAARRVFPTERIFLIGEIIHNPEVNRQLDLMGVRHLPWQALSTDYDDLTKDDVVIIPAFGVPRSFMDKLESKGVSIVDTTCGDVMKVWKRVKSYAAKGITSIIHGKLSHEETRATASRALGEDGKGKFVIIYTMEDAQCLTDWITGKISKESFLNRMKDSCSRNFDPTLDLMSIGLANQTTMLRSETQHIQSLLRDAIVKRDGNHDKFHVFETICGATQDRQDALFHLLKSKVDIMFVVGGYNSSNTTHLVEISKGQVPTYFIEQASCILSLNQIKSYNTVSLKEETIEASPVLADVDNMLCIGITAGASCPANLIEDTIRHLASLRGETIV
ncbi:MAG: 4-hydroxy-3-methylbut-2-enyl diphosphate reductase [Akkermansia sp.]